MNEMKTPQIERNNMKKLCILFLIAAVLLSGCGKQASSFADTVAADEPLTFGNAVIMETPKTEEALETLETSSEENVVGYIWRLGDYRINYESSTLLNLQSDGSGGFWIMNNAESSNGLGYTALHCDENANVLTETAIPVVIDQDNSGCDMIAYGSDAIYYNQTHFITHGGGDRPAELERMICACDLNGNVLFSIQLADLTTEENPYISDIVAMDGYCIISTESSVIALDHTGSLRWKMETTEFIDSMFRNTDGKVYIKTAFDQNALYLLDTEACTLGQPLYITEDGEVPQPGVLGYDMLLCNNATNSPKVYGLDLTSEEKTALWDCGAMGMLHAGNIVETGRGDLVLDYVTLMSGWSLGELVQEPVYEGEEVTTLTLGTIRSLSVTADTAIAMFNSLYPEYYLQVATYVDAEAMNLAILSGEGPDIICLDGLSEEDYARNGQLLDLYNYLDADETISRDELVPEYLKEYETNGGLFRLSPVFSYGYLDINSEVISAVPMTFTEYLAVAKENSNNPTWEMKAEDVLLVMLGYSMTSFVDYNTGDCFFDSEEFMSLLELVNMGRMLTEEEYMDAEWLYSPGSADIWNEVVGEGGFPGAGVLVTEPMDTFGIYAGTKHPEAAWNFFSLLLGEDIQRSYAEMTGSFPVLSSVYSDLVPDKIQEKISHAKGHWIDTSPVYDIVKEEAAAYFAGDITAEITAGHIQSRVMIYLAEQM